MIGLSIKIRIVRLTFLEHIVNGSQKHSGDGNNCFLVSSPLFQSKVAADFRKLFSPNSVKRTLSEQRLEIGPCAADSGAFFFPALSLFCGIVCLFPQAYSIKLHLAALVAPVFHSLWCLGTQRKGMVIKMESFGDKIIALRKEQGLSQDDLAKKLNVSRQTISNWETNKTAPSIDLIEEISSALNISSSAFLDKNSELIDGAQGNCSRGYYLLLSAVVLISAIHMVLGMMGKVPLFCVIVSPLFIMAFCLIMTTSFTTSIKNNDFTMIAGYKKRDSVTQTTAQLKFILLLCGVFAIVCELLFFLVYYSEQQMFGSIAIFGVYILFVVSITAIGKFKYS